MRVQLRRTNGWMDRWMDGWTDRWTHERSPVVEKKTIGKRWGKRRMNRGRRVKEEEKRAFSNACYRTRSSYGLERWYVLTYRVNNQLGTRTRASWYDRNFYLPIFVSSTTLIDYYYHATLFSLPSSYFFSVEKKVTLHVRSDIHSYKKRIVII